MGVQYLVDYENVHELGLCGMDRLAAEDCVYIFHTSVSDKISLSSLDNVRAWVKVIRVPPGKESLDRHLGSFLGYLIGRGEEDTRYAIVSRDAGYRPLADFWNLSFRKTDKTLCITSISCAPGILSYYDGSSVFADSPAPRDTIHEFIIRTMREEGSPALFNGKCMLVSDLCFRLNSLPEYNYERARLEKRPLQYLEDECRDILQIRRQDGKEWAYLLTAQTGTLANQEEDQFKPSLPAKETEAVLAVSIPADDSVPEEDLPDIMELGDLSIDDGPEASVGPEELAAKEAAEDMTETAVRADSEQDYATPPFEPDPPAQQETPKKELTEADFRDIAEDCFRYAGLLCRNDKGHVRASWLRDQLKRYPEFRTYMQKSGMKPIPYLQHLLEGCMEFYQEKGAYWASAVKESENELARKRRKFFEIAFRSIRQRLTDGGIDLNAADEIAGICMRANSETEPRKVIHTLLCQRFGNKTGAKYYRQAVKYIKA